MGFVPLPTQHFPDGSRLIDRGSAGLLYLPPRDSLTDAERIALCEQLQELRGRTQDPQTTACMMVGVVVGLILTGLALAYR